MCGDPVDHGAGKSDGSSSLRTLNIHAGRTAKAIETPGHTLPTEPGFDVPILTGHEVGLGDTIGEEPGRFWRGPSHRLLNNGLQLNGQHADHLGDVDIHIADGNIIVIVNIVAVFSLIRTSSIFTGLS